MSELFHLLPAIPPILKPAVHVDKAASRFFGFQAFFSNVVVSFLIHFIIVFIWFIPGFPVMCLFPLYDPLS